MMIKIVCDRCGREVYMKNPDLTGRAKIGYEEYDLCKHCILDIKRFINQGKAEAQTETQAETQNSNLTFEKRTMRDCYNCKRYETEGECIECHYEPKDEPKICDTCRYYNSNIPCGSTPSACKEADKFAEEFVDGLKKLKTEPQTQLTAKCLNCVNGGSYKCSKCDGEMYYKDEPQTERSE